MNNIEFVRTRTPRHRPAQDALGFGRHFSDHMFRMDYGPEENAGWHSLRVEPYGALRLDPGASVLHYAQAVFEGLKAHRGVDDVVRFFRPQAHAARLARSAEKLCMPPVPTEVFLAACHKLVQIDRDWVPSAEGTSLYVRPLLFADESFLGVRPSQSYRFIVMTSPVGAYYAEGFDPVRILVERKRVRAAHGGVGDAKTAGNYAASLQAATLAKKAGYAQVLWTDAASHEIVEEVGTMNVFFKIGDQVITPALDGSILPGITRMSVIELLRARGMEVVEREVRLAELIEAHEKGHLEEAFGSGTAAVISPIGALGVDGRDCVLGDGKVGPVARSLFDEITGIQRGRVEDRFGWMVPIES